MKVLLIGGSRFVGPFLIEKLLQGGHDITVFNRGRIQQEYPKGVRFIKGDRNDSFQFKERFDVVIDTCAYSGADTRRAVEELAFDFFVHFSTAAVYKKSEVFPLTEKSSIGPWPLWGDYNRGKTECEEVLKKSGIRYASIRPVYILGPKNYCDREHFIYSRIKKSIPLILPGNGQALVQFVFADEVAGAIAFLAENKVAGAFNCAGSEIIAVKGLVEEMGKIVGREPILKFNPAADGEKFNISEFPFANENFVVSNEKIRALGIKFTPLLEGLRENYESYYRHVV